MSPYVLGAVYNGTEDKPEPYHNDDGLNNKRVFWSRNDHMVIFDDTPGMEKVQLGAQAPSTDLCAVTNGTERQTAQLVLSKAQEPFFTTNSTPRHAPVPRPC